MWAGSTMFGDLGQGRSFRYHSCSELQHTFSVVCNTVCYFCTSRLDWTIPAALCAERKLIAAAASISHVRWPRSALFFFPLGFGLFSPTVGDTRRFSDMKQTRKWSLMLLVLTCMRSRWMRRGPSRKIAWSLTFTRPTIIKRYWCSAAALQDYNYCNSKYARTSSVATQISTT